MKPLLHNNYEYYEYLQGIKVLSSFKTNLIWNIRGKTSSSLLKKTHDFHIR